MAQNVDVTLGSLIKTMRTQRAMTQADLATLAGISESMIANTENGKRLLGADTLQAVADALRATDAERAELEAARLRQKRATDPTTADLDAKLDVILSLVRDLHDRSLPRRRREGDGTPQAMPRPALRGRGRQ